MATTVVTKSSINISSAVSATGNSSFGGGGGTTTVYTAPASSMAIVQIFVDFTSGTPDLKIDGRIIAQITADTTLLNIHIGASQALTITSASSFVTTTYITGAVIVNT